MRKLPIIIALMVVAAVALLITASDDIGTYASFEDATASGKKVKIAGVLSKDKEMYYEPEVDPNYFTFYMQDEKGVEQKVVLLSEKPQDFELSETVVLTGRMSDSLFVATEALLKCPSKYKDEEIFIREAKNES